MVTSNITKTVEYKECFQLLNFQSKEELCSKLHKIVEFLSNHVKITAKNKIGDIMQKLNEYINEMNNFDMEDMRTAVKEIEEVDMNLHGSIGRKEFREVRYYLQYINNIYIINLSLITNSRKLTKQITSIFIRKHELNFISFFII